MPQPDEPKTSDGGKPAKAGRKKKESPTPDTGPTCGQCKHWIAGSEGDGECYRNPPFVQADEESYWLIRPILEPAVRACGEFRGAN